jgi:hypothetical protein
MHSDHCPHLSQVWIPLTHPGVGQYCFSPGSQSLGARHEDHFPWVHVFMPGQPRSSRQDSFIPETHSPELDEVVGASLVGSKLEAGSGGEKRVMNAANTTTPTSTKIIIVAIVPASKPLTCIQAKGMNLMQ